MTGKVSVIVPVYKVEEYVDKCISTIAGQTYRDLEILLVINKSDDRSDLICEEWKEKDPRIQCLYPEGRGLGNARNVGIDHATGEYICFIDSDDWIDVHYVEYMLETLLTDEVDIADCYSMNAFENGRNQFDAVCCLSQYMPGRLNEAYDSPVAWRSLSRLSLWIDNEIRFTNTIAEDLSVYSLLRSVSNGISHVNKVLYYYRIRNNSLTTSVTNDIKKFTQLIEVLEWIVSEHKKRSVFEQSKYVLFKQAENHIRFNIYNYSKHNQDINTDEMKTIASDFLWKKYGKEENIITRKSLSFGSYNLGRINNYLSTEKNTWENKYCYSSVISVVARSKQISHIDIDNPFRRIQIQRDFTKAFWDRLEQDRIGVILCDCLEETRGVIEHEGTYITNSKIMCEGSEFKENGELIGFGCEKWWGLWRTAIKEFYKRIQEINNQTRIIVIKMYLSEYKGYMGTEELFDNLDDIRNANTVLKEMYTFIEKELPDVTILDLPGNGLFFSDIGFEHGCSPKHLNSSMFAYMGMKTSELLEEECQ